MEESILTTIKKLIGITSDDTSFDTDLIVHINSVFVILYQLGLGASCFSITGSDEKWSDVLDKDYLATVKSYMYLKIKPWFDSDMSSTTVNSFAESAKELEFRISVMVDPQR